MTSPTTTSEPVVTLEDASFSYGSSTVLTGVTGRVPAGQVYQTVEHAKGILGVHLVSDGGTRPFRAHFRDPSFANLQSLAMMTEGGQLADVVVSLAAIDPVLGGVDR